MKMLEDVEIQMADEIEMKSMYLSNLHGKRNDETNSEIMYILQGSGKVLCDGEYSPVTVGDVHYCPKGHEHSLINSGNEDLVFFAVVPEHK